MTITTSQYLSMKSRETLPFILCAVMLAGESVQLGFGSHLTPPRNVSGGTRLPTLPAPASYKTTGSWDSWEVRLTDIGILDKTRLFAVGRQSRKGEPEHAVLFGSSDGGRTWRRMLVDRNKWFYSVQFINAQIGWIVGYEGLILKSTDGGMTWTKQRTPTESSLMSVQMIDQRSGWVLGRDGELLHTSDGGDTWLSHKLEGHGWVWSNRSRDEFMGWLTSFYFSDRLNGWIVGDRGRAYQSTDGGVSWKSRGSSLVRNIPGWEKSDVDFKSVKFLSTKIGFIEATVAPSAERDVSPRVMLLKTEDGGATWARTVVIPGDSFGGVEILNEKEIWAIPGFGDRLLRTENGGKTWINLDLPDSGGTPIDVRFVDSQTGWLITGNGIFLDEILYTVDGGRTWTDAKLRTE